GARDQPTAVVCSNDMTAIGVMREAYDHGITIPNDVSIVGFDDIRLAQFMTPPLTTVQMSQKELAQIAFRALLDEVGRESRSTQKSRPLTDGCLLTVCSQRNFANIRRGWLRSRREI